MVSIEQMRKDALGAFDAAVAAVRPENLVPNQIRYSAGKVLIGDEALPAASGRHVVMSIGKAAPGLAAAWLETTPDWASEIFILTPHGVPVPATVEASATILRGAHPYPDTHGESSTRHLLEVAGGLGLEDLLVVLLSGGGSALMAAAEDGLELEAAEAVVLLAGGTDGVDGLSENAGAVVDPTTIARLRAAGIDPQKTLTENDSGTALETVGDAIRTGPTGTNVCDVTMVLAAPSPI